MTGRARSGAHASLRRRLLLVSRLLKVVLWVVMALSVGLALADVLAARPWYSAAAAAAVAVLSAVVLGWPARCGHYAQLFRGVEDLGYVCRRRAGHQGLHKDQGVRWDSAGAFLATGSEPAVNRMTRTVARPFAFIASLLGFGPRCGHRSQLLPGYGDMPVVCKLRRGHWGRRHRDGLAVWTGDDAGSHHAGGLS
jgi:hypothetical protein